MNNTVLINMFADGEWHSGVEVAELLGVSRAAVWKRLQKLEALGLEVEREQSKGYRLPYSFQPLEHALLADLPFKIDINPITGSTNTDALRKLVSSSEAWPKNYHAVLAEQQTEGRGRRGKTWISPYGANLYLSCAAALPVGASALETLSLNVGIVLAEILEQQGVPDVTVKWPNDVYAEGKKIAGILIEVDGDLSSYCNVVIGIGVNFTQKSLHAEQIQQPYTSVGLHSSEVRREKVAEHLIQALYQQLDAIVTGKPVNNLEKWPEYDYLRDRPVTVHLGSQKINGVAQGIDARGNLKLNLDDNSERIFSGGEVSVRTQ